MDEQKEFHFVVSGNLYSNLSIDELKAKLAICLVDVENDEKVTLDGQTKSLEVGDYNEVELKEVCPNCGTELQNRVFDTDGINLEERMACPKCGFGSPALN